jgi:hypothetical protein
MGSRDEKNHKCGQDCLCRLLRKFEGSNVTIVTKSGDMIMGEILRVRDCCVEVLEPASITPFVNERLTVIRCMDIESFSIEISHT